jgi:hypothetical protein
MVEPVMPVHVFLDAVIKGGMLSQFVKLILKGDKQMMCVSIHVYSEQSLSILKET